MRYAHHTPYSGGLIIRQMEPKNLETPFDQIELLP